MDIISKLNAVQNTLDGVEVKGRENLDRLLGCMQTIDEVLRVLTGPPAPAKSTEEVVNG